MQQQPLANPHAVSYMETGVFFALISVAFHALTTIANRYAVTQLTISPWDMAMLQLTFGGVVLLALAGFGNKGFRTLRHPFTWAIGLIRVFHLLMYILALTVLTATEVEFLVKINIFMAIILSITFYGRRLERTELGGLGLFLVGWATLTCFQSGGIWGLVFISLAAFTTALEGILAESHKELIRAMTFREHCRYTGVIMAVTGLVFFLAGAVMGLISENFLAIDHPMQGYIPHAQLDLTLLSLAVGAGVGIFFRAGYTYYMFKAIRTIKTEYYLMVTTLAPFITMGLESLLGYLGYLETHGLDGMDVLGGVILTLGALWMIVARVERENRKKRNQAQVAERL